MSNVEDKVVFIIGASSGMSEAAQALREVFAAQPKSPSTAK